jgi:hypothetical protein
MKTQFRLFHLFVLLTVLALGLMAFAPAAPPVQGPGGFQVVMGSNYTLGEGETLDGSLLVMGGNAMLAEGSTVQGDIIILGGNLKADGLVKGDVNVIGGLVSLGSTAVIQGDVNTVSANLLREEGARIEGSVNNETNFPFAFGLPGRFQWPLLPGITPGEIPAPVRFDPALSFIGGVLWWLGRSFIWAFLALLAVMFFPQRVERTAATALDQPFAAGGLGCLTTLVVPLVLILLAITICGIPIALLGLAAFALAWALGIIALGMETGKRLAALLNQDWAPSVAAALGVFLLTLTINGIGALVPCIGWLAPFTVGLIGLGAVLITRFGAQESSQPGALQPVAPLSTAPTPAAMEDLPAPSPAAPPAETPGEETPPVDSA